MSDFRREPLHDMTRDLAATARGGLPATLVVVGGTLVSVTSGEILPNMSVAVRGSRVAYVGRDASHTIGDETRIIEAGGRYIAPGFLDGHCHIESSQITVTQFARAVLPLGTTGGFFDAHEITNVLGLRGLRLMVDEARATPLAAYAASGITGDHESVTTEDAVWRLRQGMYAKLRRGSAWHDVQATIKAHTARGLDPRHIALVTDDRSPESLLREGHMNFVVRHAIQQGVRPVTAFQMATLNPAERWGVWKDVGSVTPGRFADIILLEGNLADVNVTLTIAAGKVVAEEGRMAVELPLFEYPDYSLNTVKLERPISEETFEVSAPSRNGTIRTRAIQVVENHVET